MLYPATKMSAEQCSGGMSLQVGEVLRGAPGLYGVEMRERPGCNIGEHPQEFAGQERAQTV